MESFAETSNDMNTDYYKVCYIRLGGQSSSGMASCGLLFYVHHITRETDSPDLMDFINQSILKSVQKDCPYALLGEEVFPDKKQLLQKWGVCLERRSTVLYLYPHIDDKDFMDASMREANWDKCLEMPGVPIRLYMEVVGCKEDVFSPFNRIELRYPLTLKKEDDLFVNRLRTFCKKTMMNLEDI